MSEPGGPKLRNLAVAGRELALAWGDGHESYIPFERLRRSCPCALCQKGPVATTGSGSLLAITALLPVGAYAVQVVWSDGHDTGIYPFETLRRLCPCPECAEPKAGQ